MPDCGYLEKYFDVDLSRVKIVLLQGPSNYHGKIMGVSSLQNQRGYAAHFRQIKAHNLDVFINNSYSSQLQSPVCNGIYMCMFPVNLPLRSGKSRKLSPRVRALLSILGSNLLHREFDAVHSYPVITANSEFTNYWVTKLWGRSSKIVYSVCDGIGAPKHKNKMILSVGRFSARNPDINHKRHDVLIDTFLKMKELKSEGWQLHLAGSLNLDDRQAVEYAVSLEAAAAGAPVQFHYNTELNTLRELYSQSAIYWHATGFGTASDLSPHTQEHFGITIVEAMSAGAIPIVINSGGLRETVQNGVNGYLWDNLDDLAKTTNQLAKNKDLQQNMATHAVASSLKYSRAAFNAKLDEIIAGFHQ